MSRHHSDTQVKRIELIPLAGVGEVQPGDNVAGHVLQGLAETGVTLVDGDILAVTHKVISKAEGRLVDLREVRPSDLAQRIEREWGKDARYIEVVLQESVRIVRMVRGLIISETSHGFVCANAGVDASNVSGGDVACLLPLNPDKSAEALHDALRERTGAEVAIIITDSFGRPWRNGITNIAIGVAGMAPLADYRGQPDDYGRVMSASVLAVADEVASAAELAGGKVSRCPFVVVRGYDYQRRRGTARELVMDPTSDLFR